MPGVEFPPLLFVDLWCMFMLEFASALWFIFTDVEVSLRDEDDDDDDEEEEDDDDKDVDETLDVFNWCKFIRVDMFVSLPNLTDNIKRAKIEEVVFFLIKYIVSRKTNNFKQKEI